AAAAEAAVRAKLEAAKLAAEKEAWERREAAGRASRSAAREHDRATGSTPPVPAATDETGDEAAAGEAGAADETADAASGLDWLDGPDAETIGGQRDPWARGPAGAPRRKPVSKAGVSVWGKPGRAPTWAEASAEEATSADAAEPEGEAEEIKAAPGDEAEAPAVEADEPGSEADAPERDGADADTDDAADSQELTQAFLPDFLKDEAEAPRDIVEASGRDSTEALERPDPPAGRTD
ncbi:MAG: hypothetical protein LBD90_02530, partial [Bifidobacteriaceae bacterium]|nr:hypothetical protein [Bifidobacteriaceae bacterium]